MRMALLGLVFFSVQDPNQWVEFESCEADHPPKLVIDGRDYAATDDTVLISYLADKAWPRLPGLSISLGDTNRALIRFDLRAVKEPKKAELVLAAKLSQMPPKEPFEIGVHAVTADWDDATTWNSQPAFSAEPGAKATIAPKAGEVRIDVTELLKKGLKHGLLLKVTKPVGTPGAEGREIEDALRRMMAWKTPVVASKSGKPVLAFVTAEDDSPLGMAVGESALLACLAHPDLQAHLARYATTRIVVNPASYPDGTIEALGMAMKDAKPPSLVILDDGKVVATLASIGTFDVDLFVNFLRKPLKDPPKLQEALKGCSLLRAGKFAEARKALVEDPESLYWLGCLEWRDREPEKARAAWEKAAKAKSPWALKAKARLAWPERIASFETLAAAEAVGTTTEVPAKDAKRAFERAADYLIEQQLKDGSWPVPEQPEVYRAAVTALSAHALFAWGDSFADERRKRAADAVSRATDWMRVYVAKADPGTANSWGTAYLLDYFLERHAANKAFAPSVEKAIALHVGGQLPSGAWSYDHGFGTRWKGGFGGWPKTDKGRAHSMNTGPALVSLGRAKKSGFKIDDAVIKKGVEALLAMRKKPGVYTYTWPEPENFAELDQSIGRASACELALRLLGAAKETDAGVAVDAFMKYRADLRIPVKLTPGWMAPRCTSSYFYCFAYYDASRLLAELGEKEKLAKLREDLLAVVEADGTWVDFQSTGKPYATAMALLVMRERK